MAYLKRLLALVFFLGLAVPAGAQQTVKIANIGHGYFAGPLYVAMHEKLFEKHGLTPEITTIHGGSLAFQAVFTGQVDVGVLSYEHVLMAAVQGRQLVSVFNIAGRPLNNVIVSREFVQEHPEADSLEERILALKGKRVAVPSAGGSGEKILGVLANRYGLKLPEDIELVYLGGDASSYIGAFKADMIDAALPVEPAGVQVEAQDLGQIYIDLMNGEVEEFRDLNFMTVAVKPELIDQDPELVRKVVAVFAEAQEILLDPSRGKAIMGEEFTSMSDDINERAYAVVSPVWVPDGKLSVSGAEKVYDYLGLPEDDILDFNTTFTNEFIPD